jgi:predicted metal-dependent hydrolase
MKTRLDSKSTFKKRLTHWAERLDVATHSVVIRPMKNKWASCSTCGRMTFDSKLLELPGDLQDYVIVHELLHFHAPNHGKLWKSLMHVHLGDYERQERRLRKYVNVDG